MNPTGRKLRVTVLAGGPSAERAVSLESGRAIAGALRRRGHDVFLSDIGPDNLVALDMPADVVFPALHGSFGEDGTVQLMMEHRRMAYVGSDARTSALAIDKQLTKRAVAALGVATPLEEVWTIADLRAAQRDGAAAVPRLSLPVIVKPVDQGSSVGTSIVRRPADFAPAVELCAGAFTRALVEQFIVGEEVTVGIVNGEALPPICVRPRREFYDYAAKYEADDTEYVFDLPDTVADSARRQSCEVFAALGCRHLARVDWMLDRDGQLWFLEVNTLPGFTSHSLVPKAAARAGIAFDDLVERLAWLGCESRR